MSVTGAPSELQVGPGSAPENESQDELQDIIRDLERTQLAAIAKQDERSSSHWSGPPVFRTLQSTNGCIKNGRPATQTALPIGLYHTTFDNFSKNLRSCEPPSSLYTLMNDFLPISQKTFEREDSRDTEVSDIVGQLIGETFTDTQGNRARPDGMITGPGGTCCVLMEIENDISGGGCDPSIQAAISYSKYWGSRRLDKVCAQCCCPSILIAVAGPWICILGAVFVDHPIVQPLTELIWFGENPQDPSRLDYLVRVVHCVSLARQELQAYYNTLPQTDPQPGRFFPYITHYFDSSNCRVNFRYISKLAGADSTKAVFLAVTQGTNQAKKIVVRFVQKYHSEAHELLASKGLAPHLLYDSSRARENQLGTERRMIVMDRVDGVDLDSYMKRLLAGCVLEDVQKALQALHDAEIVFGDLRPPNVMVVQNAGGFVTGGMLVDFDWCGKHGEDVYPLCMNSRVRWARGMGPRKVMYKCHDNEMYQWL